MKPFLSRFAVCQAPSTVLNVRIVELCDELNDARADGRSVAVLVRERGWVLRELEGRKCQILEAAYF